MFDPTKGQQAADARLDQMSDRLAADAVAFLNDPSIPRARKEAALSAAANIFADPDQLTQLAQGTYAQDSAGKPAAQLGTGRSNAQEGLQAILDDPQVDGGIKLALKRLLTPRDPDHIPVGRDGTPAELVATRSELASAKAERDTARSDLTNERDASRTGSLAKRLADVTAERDDLRANAGGYDQAAAHAKATELVATINAQKGKMGGGIDGKDAVLAKVREFVQAVGLRRTAP